MQLFLQIFDTIDGVSLNALIFRLPSACCFTDKVMVCLYVIGVH